MEILSCLIFESNFKKNFLYKKKENEIENPNNIRKDFPRKGKKFLSSQLDGHVSQDSEMSADEKAASKTRFNHRTRKHKHSPVEHRTAARSPAQHVLSTFPFSLTRAELSHGTRSGSIGPGGHRRIQNIRHRARIAAGRE